jgi:hypothetical protein
MDTTTDTTVPLLSCIMRSAVFDPSLFIGAPFRACPNCQQQEFGTLMISNKTVTRRCRKCWHTETQRLPALQKKIIYLDQMAYSGMAKTFDPVWAAATRSTGEFWARLFDAVERAFKLQLIVCPNSTIHEKESALAAQPTMLRAIYEHLGHGASFEYPTIIHQHQLTVALRAVLAGESPVYDLERSYVIRGDPDQWTERLRISVEMAGLRPEAATERRVRDRSHDAMVKLFERWRTERSKTFNDWYQQERSGSAQSLAILYDTHSDLLRRVYSGQAELSEDVWNPRLEVGLVSTLIHVAREAGLDPQAAHFFVRRFLFSDAAYDAPANDIGALLVAAVARKAASGQRRPPSPGMWNDIVAISSFLPYCDAMFLDNECAALLSEEPLRTKLACFKTRIFSCRTGEDFLQYLSDLEKDAGPEHASVIDSVYGANWSVPYRELFLNARVREARTTA